MSYQSKTAIACDHTEEGLCNKKRIMNVKYVHLFLTFIAFRIKRGLYMYQ